MIIGHHKADTKIHFLLYILFTFVYQYYVFQCLDIPNTASHF